MAEVEVTRDGAVQTITLNRPEVLNAFNRALHAALRDALKEARDPDVRAVVITGAGRGFSAGLRAFATFASPPTTRASSPASSGSGSCPMPAGRISSTACSARRAHSSGWRPTDD
jgi:enoyl-CoA hydratase/carnithine racemase